MTDTVARAIENWPLIDALLDQALDQPAEQRAAWVAQLPPGYTALKSDVEKLLARGQPDAVTQIGPWRLLQKIGEGGMASVWLAERSDGLLKRPVAVKLPHGGWQRGIHAERLKREREVLARLDHPNIARLLDAGIGADGQPYLALEYVDGAPIDDYCRAHGLGTEARLRLFLEVTGAISAAHRMLVIHRDLKPSNILVTAAGEVRVLDFGIAKLLDGSESQDTELTRWLGRALTFDYASPEQISGDPLTVATDVYSLGVVLYELITGSRPAGRPGLRGDLGTVLNKALKQNPAERYGSVEVFAEDVRRFLENRPVLARPDSVWYRTSKFVRRHSVGVAATAVVAATVLAGTAGMAWQTQIALEQKRQAEEMKESLVALLFDAHAYRGTGKPLSALDLLRQMQQRVSRLKVAPPARVEVLNYLGASLLSLQDTAGAESVLSQAVADAGALDAAHPQRSRARLLRNWVRLFREQFTEAMGDIEDLVAAMRSNPTTFPEDLAAGLRLRSALLRERGDAGAAELPAQEALAIASKRLGPHHNQTVLALVELSAAYNANGRAEAALATAELACRRALEAYGGSRTHPNVLKARVARAEALAASGQLPLAIRETEQAIKNAEVLFGRDSRMAELYRRTLAGMRRRPETSLSHCSRSSAAPKRGE
jgi:tRNA A-37 threonylcarbamoyl transferase component Bud32/tetratricopeptide (TPR) repeat protein